VVGVDLSDPLHPDVFLDTTDSNFELDFAARGKGVNFTGSLGPAGLFIQDGQVALDADGDVATDNDPMSFKVNLDDQDSNPSDGRLSFSDLSDISVSTDPFVGALNATLPIFFPSDCISVRASASRGHTARQRSWRSAKDLPAVRALLCAAGSACFRTRQTRRSLGRRCRTPVFPRPSHS